MKLGRSVLDANCETRKYGNIEGAAFFQQRR
jgi:hypothetical protein